VRFSNRFLQNAVLICEQATSGRIDSGIESIDPHRIIIVSADTAKMSTLVIIMWSL
jgi:hypothetical protein